MATFQITVEGMTEFRSALARSSPEIQRRVGQAMREAVGPVVAEARARMAALPGTGRRAAEGISGGVVGEASVYWKLGERGGFVFPREFGGPHHHRVTSYEMHFVRGPKAGKTYLARRANQPLYNRPTQFGEWTGNQFTVEAGRVAGHAFFPSIHDGFGRVVEAISVQTEEMLRAL